MLGLVIAAAALPALQWVVLKMLPFDNKSEFQLVLDMPEGSSLEQTQRTLIEVGQAGQGARGPGLPNLCRHGGAD